MTARRTWAIALIAIAAATGGAPARAMPPGADGVALRRAHDAVGELRLEQAQRDVTQVASRHPQDPDVLYVQALLKFHDGDYQGAVNAMEGAIARATGASGLEDWRALRELMAHTRDATRGFEQARSSDARFVVSYEPGRDEVIVPYALEALRRADDALTRELGVRVPGPIRLEIYPTAESLARVSTLSVEEIRRTGTIALCKWDRLMITSPRALVRGYPWMDTIGHEYVHLVLSRASRDRAPVWLQEGVAKFLERRWRGETGGARLDPASEGLLQRAVQNGRLLPFDRLHPSIARLPSQEDAALAFAQVATFVETFHARHGAGGLRGAITRIAEGTDARDAFAAVAGEPWQRLETRWKDSLRSRPHAGAEPPRVLALRFRHGEGEVDDSIDVEEERARRFLRLGDLLWEHARPRAAATEYARAHQAAPDDPIVASRLARASLAGGDPERAIAALERVLVRYPEHAPAHAVLASARLARGDRAGARAAAIEAIRINPFDPQPHCDLAAVAGDAEERRREQQACRDLGGG